MYQFNATIPIILASTSPRRRELLDQVAVPHTCAAVNIDESPLAEESAIDYIRRMVSQKAQAALQVLPKAMTECVVITADTIGVLPDGSVLQKPNDFCRCLCDVAANEQCLAPSMDCSTSEPTGAAWW